MIPTEERVSERSGPGKWGPKVKGISLRKKKTKASTTSSDRKRRRKQRLKQGDEKATQNPIRGGMGIAMSEENGTGKPEKKQRPKK